MRTTRFLAPALAVLLCASPLFAQDAAPSCPTVRVSCPDEVSESNDLSFTADVSGGDETVTPTYNWAISAGTIASGQGTSTIAVNTEGLAGMTVTATVDVGGYDRACSTSSSCTTSVAGRQKAAEKFAEYETRDLAANTEVLDRFVRALLEDPDAQGYIIGYGGRTSGPDDAQTALDRATDYTMTTRKMDGARTLAGVGGYREQPTIELFLAAPGAAPPMATPTVDPADVKPKNANP